MAELKNEMIARREILDLIQSTKGIHWIVLHKESQDPICGVGENYWNVDAGNEYLGIRWC